MELGSVHTASANKRVCRVEANSNEKMYVSAGSGPHHAVCMVFVPYAATTDCGDCVGSVGGLRFAPTARASIFVECVRRLATCGHGCGAPHSAFFDCVRKKKTLKPVLWSGVLR